MNAGLGFNSGARGTVFATALLAASWWSGAAYGHELSYKEDVFPIIEIRCLECHKPGGVGYETSGLDLRTYEGLMKGTKHGPMVLPRRATESNLIAVIDGRTSPELRMPHNRKRMSKCERLIFRFWINQGARNN
jgi:hypothetical protein